MDDSKPAWDFFLSYASEDEERAQELYAILTGQSRVFFAPKSVVAGQDWDVVVDEALRSTRVVVVLMSKHTKDAYYQREEIANARDLLREKRAFHRLVPVRLDDSQETLPAGTGVTQALRAGGQGGIAAAAQELLKVLGALPHEPPIAHSHAGPDTADSAALRAFLQRGEVRLSTMHRIAGVFLNGAGFLVLFPVFFTSAVLRIVDFFKDEYASLGPIAGVTSSSLQAAVLPLGIAHIALSGVSTLVSVALPLYALYYLIRDLVQFYFTAHHYGYLNTRWFHPRFILSGLALPTDDNTTSLRARVFAEQREKSLLRFLVSFDANDRDYYDKILDATKDEIIPHTRRSEVREYAESIADQSREKIDVSPADLKQLYCAFGLAGLVDRSTIQEVAKMELSLSRHALGLRRLVLRYFKALIMFTWTTVVFVGVAMLLSRLRWNGTLASGEELATYVPLGMALLALTYATWAHVTPILARLPVRLIYAMRDPSYGSEVDVQMDTHLVEFETTISKWCRICFWSWVATVLLTFVLGAAMYRSPSSASGTTGRVTLSLASTSGGPTSPCN